MGSKNKNKKKSGTNGVADSADGVVEQELTVATDQNGVLEELNGQPDDQLDSEEPEELELAEKVADIKIDSDEVAMLRQQLEEKTKENEKNELNYQNLLSKLSGMKTLFGKMKQGEIELAAKELENELLKSSVKQSEEEKKVLISTIKDLKEEITNLNSECVSLNERTKTLQNELENSKNTVTRLTSANTKLTNESKELRTNQEEYLIMMNEEKLQRQNLKNEISELKQIIQFKDTEIGQYSEEIASLNGKLSSLSQDILKQNRDFEQKTSVLNNTIDTLKNQLQETDNSSQALKSQLATAQEEITRLEKFEKDNKDKQLQIGKLRHELIILNDHLTKALKLIKKDSNNETVDKELVSNLFISFLNLPRGDSKKFQALELIANYLNWDKEMRVHAGIQNKSTNDELSRSRQSFVSLWTEYLEKESTKENGSLK